ncbi:phage tail family protein [Clostridium estertheticum]|uniref:Phage tail family protein n=1 Tax=Clostridium estertheticum TaxID=238834 RepID=A0AA47I7Y5_9CLOT|nr:phage tail family protein [Clostridium estertheticum]MBU3153894.1 phage tail family protein [Clostridium estertheticum]WAG61330.1 phage tail family protein [Clostridium estertheticum]
MSKTITFINSLGEELVLTNSAPFLLQSFTQSGNVNIYSSKSMNQDGKNYLGNTLDIMDISLEVALVGNTKEELQRYKNKVIKILNPKNGEGWLCYKNNINERKVKCIINKIPFFNIVNSNRVYNGLISLTANNPFWTDLIEDKEEIALWKGDFSFSEDGSDGFELVVGGIEIGHRELSLIVNILNSGDVECGMRIEFKALATLTNPNILNVNTGEYIKINKGMVAGEVISISTYFGSKKVDSILDGVTTNIFNYIDFQSTFLQLDVGDNLFRYNSDTGIDNLEVSIYYQQQYLGV